MKDIYVTRSSMPPYEEYCEEIKELWDTAFLTNNGVKHQQLEKELCEQLHVANVSLFTNGHLALQTAIKALHLKGEVITTPFTFCSTVNAIIENGLTPVFCDIREDDYTIDVEKLEKLINKDTCAIVPVHVYGNICDVEAIEKLAKKYKLKVIYDAAHVFGVTYQGRSICEYGDISMLSFHATKVFNTIEGGALIYQDAQWYSRFKALKNFGLDDIGHMKEESINAKMNEFQASMGLCNLRHVFADIKKREEVALAYDGLLKDVRGIRINKRQDHVTSNYAYYPIYIDADAYGMNSGDLLAKLQESRIHCRRYFYPLVSDYAYYMDLGYTGETTPIAKRMSDNILCLPIYADLKISEVEYICELISRYQKNS